MTIIEALTRFDNLKPNTYTTEEKIAWLSQVDGMIAREIMDTHETEFVFHGYDAETDTRTMLLADEPFDNLYLSWLESRVDYYNGEYNRYNNSNAVFTAEYTAFQNHFNRTHKPKGTQIRYF